MLSCKVDFYFDVKTKKCVRVDFMTNPETANIIYAYPISQYEDQYNKKKVSDPYARDCPSDSPYFNTDTHRCMKCPDEYPYFNLHSNMCQSCGDEGYDAENTRCFTKKVHLDPTLERLIMNIK